MGASTDQSPVLFNVHPYRALQLLDPVLTTVGNVRPSTEPINSADTSIAIVGHVKITVESQRMTADVTEVEVKEHPFRIVVFLTEVDVEERFVLVLVEVETRMS